MKYKRQNQIKKIVKNAAIHTHDELIEALKNEGFIVTQATVSRDIKELGLIKVPSLDGSSAVYSMPTPQGESGARTDMVSVSVKRIESALHTVVINTYPGMASAVAASIDRIMSNEILGSIAGDDTVLIITASPERAEAIRKKLIIEFRMA